MAKKPDYSSANIPALIKYCDKNGLTFSWKNGSQGHAEISNSHVEAYVWVQRMVIGVRKRNGVELSKALYERTPGFQFNKKVLDNLLFTGSKTTSHTTRHGIKVTRVPSRATV